MPVQDHLCKITFWLAQKLHCLKWSDFVKVLLLKLFTVRELYCSHVDRVQVALFTILTSCISNELLNLVWHHWNPLGCFGACLPMCYCQYNKGDIFSRQKRNSHTIHCPHIMQLQKPNFLLSCADSTLQLPS